ncbi:MAG: DUF2092 domain-containing protein [Planctomycetota bacterium]|nr:DUF2092 domain-containing protein [Planctomycetota bacterium]
MPRTPAIRTMLAAALAALALTIGDSAAKDRKDDSAADSTTAAKTPAHVDKTTDRVVEKTARVDTTPVSRAASKTLVKNSAETASTVRYAARSETLKSQPVRTADTSRRFDASSTQRPVNYGSLRNVSSAAVTVPGRFTGTGSHAAVSDNRVFSGNTGSARTSATTATYNRNVITSQRGNVVVSPHLSADRRTQLATSNTRLRSGERFTDRRPVNSLSSRHRSYSWQGRQYEYDGYNWYSPYLYDGYTSYWPVYPPAGFYYSDLPYGYVSLYFGGQGYYRYDNVYYRRADGRAGYVVVDPPQDVETYVTAAPAAAGPDPYAILHAMADYTTGLPRLTLSAANIFDEITASGSKIQLAEQNTLFLQRPDRLLVQTHGDGDDRVTLYDGRSLTLYDARRNVFSRLAAPNAVDAALDSLARNYGVSLPLAELVTSSYDSLAAPLLTAQYLGLAMVGPYTCHHLAFTQNSLDWEIWIDSGPVPIPRQYSLTYKQLPQAPRFISTIQTWNDSPIAAGNLQLALPSNAQAVDMVPVPR